MTLSYPLQTVFPSAEDCQECRGLLQQALQKLSGVRSVSVDAKEVKLEADRDLKTDVTNIISDITQTHSHTTFKVEGMDCASCAKTVEGAVCRLPGVSDYKLNYMAEKLEVAYNPKETTPQDFAKKIEPLGYKVRVVRKEGPGAAPAVNAATLNAPTIQKDEARKTSATPEKNTAGKDKGDHDHDDHDDHGRTFARCALVQNTAR
jgi:Zn2+/Cd2+-exporting ATPase